MGKSYIKVNSSDLGTENILVSLHGGWVGSRRPLAMRSQTVLKNVATKDGVVCAG